MDNGSSYQGSIYRDKPNPNTRNQNQSMNLLGDNSMQAAASRTATGFGAFSTIKESVPAREGNLLMKNFSNDANIKPGDIGTRGGGRDARKAHHQTIDAQEDMAASVADTISAGGTRYMVQLKGGGLKFYGQGSHADLDDSNSQFSRGRAAAGVGAGEGEPAENMSRIDYENLSAHQSVGAPGGFAGAARAYAAGDPATRGTA